ncbi:MAG: hypothetical protein K2L07_11405 [Lachnospiraceae bacterium]|nr:hypothetical protein [Lachnospiraceae bacterium]
MKNIVYILKSIIGLFVVICFLFLTIGNFKTAVQMSKNNEIKEFKRSIKITDQYEEKNNISLYEFFSKPDTLLKLENAYSKILAHFGKNYYEISDQSVEYIGLCDFDEKFVSGGKEAKNQNIQEINEIITPLNSVQLGPETIENIKLNELIQSGRIFSEEEYILDEKNMVIPLILGNDYKDYCEIDDTFFFFYLGEKFSGKIIAFLEEDSSINIGDEETKKLDNLIVMPSLKPAINYEETDFNKILALIKTEGFILYETVEEYQDILDEIDIIREETGVLYSCIENLDIVPLEQHYFMPVFLAVFFVVLGELLFVIYVIYIQKLMQKIVYTKNFFKIMVILCFFTLSTYEISYLSIIKLRNTALALNVMRIRDIVLVELLIALVLNMLMISWKIFKKSLKERVNESNRCN